jgi:hypothetical protein
MLVASCCHAEVVLEALTGAGLATSAGLNAYIPLLAIGVLSRFTDVVALPAGWGWLGNGWVILILGVLLAIEVVADKVPVLDSANDVVQTVVRPTAGGIAFGAGTSSSTTVSDPGSFFGSHQWVPVAVGVLLALGVHAVKATARPVINVGTAGFGAPIVSTLEDIASVAMSLVALVLPVLIVVFLLGLVVLFVWALRRRGARRRSRAVV